ncbi:MAG: hypothetical protein U9R19_00140 [Bacteroidota bacterium]|nr:hypothetical protein [Bacteroidota bacterium]
MRNIANSLNKKYPDITAYLLFAAIAAIAFWQVSFLSYSLKWDMIDCYLPWRYFVGECWQNGIIPFWNPYQHFGYPIHADFRSAWFPEMFIIGLTGGYSNITLHFLTIFYLSMAGFGMYKLSSLLIDNRQIALITGIAWMLSGFFIGHGQDISFFISGAFIPLILYYYLSLGKKPDLLNSLKAALFMLLMVFGSYPAFTIFLNYILPVFFVYNLFILIKQKQKKFAWQFIGLNMLLYLIVVAGSLVLLLTYPQIEPYSVRFAGLGYDDFIINSFTPQSLISWLVPFVLGNNHDIFHSDITMINGYWGVLMMIFSVFAFRKKNHFVLLFLIISIISLLLSFGPGTPVHPFFYDFVPGINLFRMPAVFILFTIIGFLIISGFGLKYITELYDVGFKKLKRVLLVGIGVMAIVAIIGLLKFPYHDTVFWRGPDSIQGFLKKITFFEQLVFHGILQTIILTIFYFWLSKGRKEKFLFKVGVIVFLEMALAVQLNMNFTGVNNFKPLELHKELAKKPLGFPVPDNRPLSCNKDFMSKMMPLWQNVSIFSKRPGYQGFNSFVLKQYDDLTDNYPELAQSVINNPVVFLSDKIYPLSELDKIKSGGLSGNEVFVEDSILLQLKLPAILHRKGDTALITLFSPDEIIINYAGQNPQILNLLQANYFGWQLYMDGKPIEHFTSNILFRAVLVPGGQHQLIFRYENRKLKNAFYFSYSVLFFLLIFIVFLHYKKLRKQNRTKAILFLAIVKVVFGIIVILVIMNQMKLFAIEKGESKLMKQASEIISNEENIIGIANISHPENWKNSNSPFHFVHLLDRTDLVNFYNIIDTCQTEKLLLVWHNREPLIEVEEIIRLKYRFVQKKRNRNRGGLILFSKTGNDERSVLFSHLEKFETEKNKSYVDSLYTVSELSSPTGKAFHFNPAIVWGPRIREEIRENIDSDHVIIFASCDITIPDECDVIFSIQIFRNGEQKIWDRVNLRDFILSTNRWEKVVLGYEPNFRLKKGDIIKAFVWNRGKTNFMIDNYEMKILR